MLSLPLLTCWSSCRDSTRALSAMWAVPRRPTIGCTVLPSPCEHATGDRGLRQGAVRWTRKGPKWPKDQGTQVADPRPSRNPIEHMAVVLGKGLPPQCATGAHAVF